MILTPADLLALCQRHGASPGVSRIATACALVESGGVTDGPPGDNGHSVGLWMLHDEGLGAGMTVAERQDPDTAAARILPVFSANYAAGQAEGLRDERLARYTAMETEKPQGWPWLDSPAADKYAAMWATIGEPTVPTDLRTAFLDKIRSYTGKPYVFGGKSPETSFDCSGLLTYCGAAVGVDLGPPLMTSADALRQYCDPIDPSEAQPGDLLLFSQTYGDTGPDYATHCGASLGSGTGRMLDTHEPPGVGETDIYQPYWQQHLMGVWRPRAFVEAPVPVPTPDADPRDAQIVELINRVGYLKDAGRIAREDIEAALAVPRLPRKAREVLQYGALPAVQTVERGGPPEDGQ